MSRKEREISIYPRQATHLPQYLGLSLPTHDMVISCERANENAYLHEWTQLIEYIFSIALIHCRHNYSLMYSIKGWKSDKMSEVIIHNNIIALQKGQKKLPIDDSRLFQTNKARFIAAEICMQLFHVMLLIFVARLKKPIFLVCQNSSLQRGSPRPFGSPLSIRRRKTFPFVRSFGPP